MAELNMLSSHSARRDHNGVPVVPRKRKRPSSCMEENWNATRKILLSVVESLGTFLDHIKLLETCVLHQSFRADSLKASASTIEAITSTNDRLVEDEITLLNDREVVARQRFEEILSIAQLVMKYSLRDIPYTLPDAISPQKSSKPQTLIRIFRKRSHTSYSDDLGFCCSKWKSSEPVKSFSDLQKDNKILRQSLRNHCEGNDPSEWISLTDDVLWALKFIKSHNFYQDPTSQVALVSIPRLSSLEIICDQSDHLVKAAGAHPYSGSSRTGVQFAWPGHYIVHGWIPAACICRVFDLEHFRRACIEHNFHEGQSSQKNSKTILVDTTKDNSFFRDASVLL